MYSTRMPAHRVITVDLGDRSYPIFVGSGLLDGGLDLTEFVAGDDCLIVSNVTVAPLYGDRILANLAGTQTTMIELPDGEAHKSFATMQTILDKLVESGANRDTTVIALGGGVVGDIAGFAAACYMRGVSFIQIPTTLLHPLHAARPGTQGGNGRSDQARRDLRY